MNTCKRKITSRFPYRADRFVAKPRTIDHADVSYTNDEFLLLIYYIALEEKQNSLEVFQLVSFIRLNFCVSSRNLILISPSGEDRGYRRRP